MLDARAELQQIEERLAALPGLEETLERFREAGLEERLKEQSLLVARSACFRPSQSASRRSERFWRV